MTPRPPVHCQGMAEEEKVEGEHGKLKSFATIGF